jgi:hypothetical protein
MRIRELGRNQTFQAFEDVAKIIVLWWIWRQIVGATTTWRNLWFDLTAGFQWLAGLVRQQGTSGDVTVGMVLLPIGLAITLGMCINRARGGGNA